MKRLVVELDDMYYIVERLSREDEMKIHGHRLQYLRTCGNIQGRTYSTVFLGSRSPLLLFLNGSFRARDWRSAFVSSFVGALIGIRIVEFT